VAWAYRTWQVVMDVAAVGHLCIQRSAWQDVPVMDVVCEKKKSQRCLVL
jgi:hypothetical protein